MTSKTASSSIILLYEFSSRPQNLVDCFENSKPPIIKLILKQFLKMP